jgi:hypothetical protein
LQWVRSVVEGIKLSNIGKTLSNLMRLSYVTDRRSYNHIKTLSIRRNAFMRVENMPVLKSPNWWKHSPVALNIRCRRTVCT